MIDTNLEHESESNEQPSTEAGRRQSLLQATFDVIATSGFEGLRTRAVAERAGVNIATLHYYFPTKEALIGALAQFLGAKFVTTHAPPVPTSGRQAVDRLRQEFADSVYYMTECADLMVVMQELGLRANRDETVARVLRTMTFYWRQHLAQIVREGIADGTFLPSLDPDAVASTLMATLSGMGAVGVEAIDSIRQVFEQWLVIPEGDGEVL